MKRFFLTGMALLLLFFATGCDEVTYPKETLRESIISMCNKEYCVDIDVAIIGNTLAIYLPLMHLFDVSFSLSEDAQEKIQNVIMSASRATLSTDAEIKFYCLIAQDIRLPEVQLVIVKYVDDVKKAYYQNISRGEYFKRTIIDMSENPQAKKEKAIEEVFEKMGLDENTREKVMDDFFRSEPSSLSGIGYWNGKFYMKDIDLKEFLAEQMANRIKTKFRESESLGRYSLGTANGKFVDENKVRFFLISLSVESLLLIFDPAGKAEARDVVFKSAFMEISDVIRGYKFDDFDIVKIIEQNTNAKLAVSKYDMYLFKQKKLGMDAILGAIN